MVKIGECIYSVARTVGLARTVAKCSSTRVVETISH